MAGWTLKKIKKNYNDKIFVTTIMGFAVVFFSVIYFYPFIMNLFYMFTNYNYLNHPKIIGLKNIMKFLSDPLAWRSIRNTLLYAGCSVPIVIVVSLLISMCLFYIKIGKQFLRSVIFTTFLPGWIIGAIIFKQWYSNEGGIINYTLQCLGLGQIPWLTDTSWAIVGIIILNIWVYIGYYSVIFLAGLSNMNHELFEAAKIDGANRVKTFIYITIPQLMPTIVFSIIISSISYLRTFPSVVVLTLGGPARSTQSLLYYMFDSGFNERNVGYGATLAFALFLIILVVSLVQMKITKLYSE